VIHDCQEFAGGLFKKNAYCLWEAAGRPVSDGVEFWIKAENELPEHNGIKVLQ
jgi:hypothetical protein